MIVEYSKDFERTVRKLSGKRLESVRNAILEVKNARNLTDITDCIKMQDMITSIVSTSAITVHSSTSMWRSKTEWYVFSI